MSRVYLFDTKLYAYNEIQRHGPITQIFNTIARDLISLKKRGKVYVTFDIGHSSFREGEQSYYKGHRRVAVAKKSQEKQDAHAQFNIDYLALVPLFRALDVTVVAVDGVEADDLMSLITLRHPEAEVVLMTADRDHLHSVVGTTNVKMYSAREHKWFDHDYVVEEYGVSTRRDFTILKAMAKDAGDNLMAFRNMGPIKAKKVFGSLPKGATDDDAIQALEGYLEDNPRVVIHELHIEEGRDTVRKAFLSNMEVGATFTDYTHMTKEQIAEYEESFNFIRDPEADFEALCIELFGFPILLSEQAKRVYGV